jgi:YHS domain-containing protein
MRRLTVAAMAAVVVTSLWSNTALAHFLWLESVKPGASGPAVRMYFSETAQPDDPSLLDRLGDVRAFFRSIDGKPQPLPLRRADDALVATEIGNDPSVIALSHTYGVMTRGDETFLLQYHAKAYRATRPADWQRFGTVKELPLEIMPRLDGQRMELTVLWHGKPLAGAEVVVSGPGITSIKEASDGEGRVAFALGTPGVYSARARHFESAEGSGDGKKYSSVRHYSTLTVSLDEAPSKAAPGAAKVYFPPLPVAVSSFGAAVCDGYAYVYGGHSGQAHDYSTETVIGSFIRIDLANPSKGWEVLPGGPALQGLALVEYKGKLIRVGGMQPRNAPGEESDTVSVASCAVFDPKSKTWTALADLPKGRSSHDATVVGDQLVVVGGWCLNGRGGEREWHDAALELDLSKKGAQWQTIEQPFRRRALNTVAMAGKVYAVCGMTSDNELELGVDVLDVAAKKWAKVAPIPGPIRNGFTPAACASDGRLYANPSDGKLYRLAAGGEAWEEAGAAENPRVVHRMLAIRDNRLLVLGGASRNGNVAVAEAIEPSPVATATSASVTAPDATKQTCCPVMTKMPVDGESREVEYKGVTIKVCCAACEKKLRAEPEAYLDVIRLPQLGRAELPGRALEQVFCPVYRDRVVSSKDPSVDYRGVKVYLFNETAKKKFLADPTAYADQTILPQLRNAK